MEEQERKEKRSFLFFSHSRVLPFLSRHMSNVRYVITQSLMIIPFRGVSLQEDCHYLICPIVGFGRNILENFMLVSSRWESVSNC